MKGYLMYNMKIVFSFVAGMLFSVSVCAQYMGCPETLTGICPPPHPAIDMTSTAQKVNSLNTKRETVQESMLDTTQTLDKQTLTAGGEKRLSAAAVPEVASPNPNEEVSSTKEGDEPIENPTESVINAEQNKLVSDAGTLKAINQKKLTDAYEHQAETIDMLANILFLKSQLASLKEVADKIETVVPGDKSGTDENLNTAFRGNAALRLVWSQLLTYKQQVLALRLKQKALDMKSKMRDLTTPIIESEEDTEPTDKTV